MTHESVFCLFLGLIKFLISWWRSARLVFCLWQMLLSITSSISISWEQNANKLKWISSWNRLFLGIRVKWPKTLPEPLEIQATPLSPSQTWHSPYRSLIGNSKCNSAFNDISLDMVVYSIIIHKVQKYYLFIYYVINNKLQINSFHYLHTIVDICLIVGSVCPIRSVVNMYLFRTNLASREAHVLCGCHAFFLYCVHNAKS